MRTNRIRFPSLLRKMRYPASFHFHSNKEQMVNMADKIVGLYPTEDITLVVSGSSGAIISSLVAHHIGNRCSITYIRRESEDSAHTGIMAGWPPGKDILIFLDDFIENGDTMNRIYNALHERVMKRHFVVDCVCVTGKFYLNKLGFKVKNTISG